MVARSGFLRLDDVVLPAPLPALLAIAIVAGLAFLGWRLAARLRGGRPEPLDAAAGFVAATAVVAAVVHGLALAQLARIAALRPLGWALAATGVWALARYGRAMLRALRAGLAELSELSELGTAPRWERLAVALVAVTLLALGAAALGPPTDADSIQCHLAVPLDWLRHGGAYARDDWWTSRQVGLGEALSLLGLGAGTDDVGAVLALGGLVAAAVAVASLAATPRDRRLAWLLVVGCPVAAFLVPSQKPQMLPAAATTIALVLAVKRADRFGTADAALASTCVAFAFGCKASFLLTGGFALLPGLLAARRSGRLGVALGLTAAALALFWAPGLARSAAFFGDPLSPFLERFRSAPDPQLVAFATALRDAGDGHTLAGLLRLPLALLGTANPGALTTPLGLGALGFVAALGVRGPTKGSVRTLLWAALGAAAATLVFAMWAGRFFLEPFLWAGAAFALAPWDRAKKLAAAGLVVQGTVSAAVAVVGAALLFPGALTPGLRDAVLSRSASGYAESRWLEGFLPRGAVIVAPQSGFELFAPRRFAVADRVVDQADPGDPHLPNLADERLRQLIERFGVNAVVDDSPPAPGPFARLEKRCGLPMGPPRELPLGARNPFNRRQYTARAFALRPDCFPR
jgi:hypothetical protein